MKEHGYKAFLSYHHDLRLDVVSILHRDVQRFGRPLWRPSAIRLYRDRTDISANPGLWPVIEKALDDSEYFVLFASPEAAESSWVQREVTHWIERKDHKAHNFLIVLLRGTIAWDAGARDFDWHRTDALPRLVGEGDPLSLGSCFDAEPFYVDLTWARKRSDLSMRTPAYFDAVVTLSSTLHGRPKADMMWQDAAEHRRSIRAWQIAAVLAVLTLGGVGWAALSVHYGFERVKRERIEERRELQFHRQKNLYEEVEQNLRTANLHLETLFPLVTTDGPLWPPDWLDKLLRPQRVQILESPFSHVQFATLQAQPELVSAEVWERATAFYKQIDAIEDTRRMAFDNIDQARSTYETTVGTAGWGASRADAQIDTFATLVRLHFERIEGGYRALMIEGIALGEAIAKHAPGVVEPGATRAFVQRHTELLAASEADRLGRGIKEVVLRGHPIWRGLDALFAGLDPTDKPAHLSLVKMAVAAGYLTLAREVLAATRTRFAADDELVRLVDGALFKLDHPATFTLATGVLVVGFAEPSAGRDNGIRAGDFLLRYNDRRLDTIDDLGEAIDRNQASVAGVLLLRKGELRSIEVPRGRLGVSVQHFGW